MPSPLTLPCALAPFACLKMNLGFVFIRYGEVTDTETTAFKRRVYYSQEGAHLCTQGHMGKHQGGSGGRRRKAWARALIVVSTGRDGRGRVGKFKRVQDWLV